MTKKITLSDFTFRFSGYGLYIVHYFSPIKKIEYKGIITDMQIIDKTKNCDNPKAKNLRLLKKQLYKL